MRVRPVQFVGDLSYSLYLWHWPLLILAPFVVGGSLDAATKVAILMLTFLASWLSKVLIEDPIRRGPLLTTRCARWTFASAVLAGAFVVGVTACAGTYVQGQVREQQLVSARILASHPACFGAASRDPEHPCTNPGLRRMVVPSPVAARSQPNAPCTFLDADGFRCEFGVRAKANAGTVALIGDSHAGHWRGALEAVAQARRWRGLAVIRTGCAFSNARRDLPEPRLSGCRRWKQRVVRWLEDNPDVQTVVQSQVAGGAPVITSRHSKFDAAVDGYLATWQALPDSVRRIVVLRDTPGTRGTTAACVQRAIEKRRPADTACSVPRREALPRDPAAEAARRAGGRIVLIDLTDFFCNARTCYPVVGGALVYKDDGHLTATFAKTLGPFLLRAFDRVSPPATS